jgi:ribosomal RNA-processing protein 8
MPLFEVPGWSMSTDPVKNATKSRKRKRSIEHDDDEDDKLQAAQINLDKLMETLKGGDTNEKPKKKKQKSKKHDIGNSSDPKNNKEKKGGKDDLSSQKKPNDKKTKRKDESSIQTTAKLQKQADPSPGTKGLTKFQNRMKHSLDGARFRYAIDRTKQLKSN